MSTHEVKISGAHPSCSTDCTSASYPERDTAHVYLLSEEGSCYYVLLIARAPMPAPFWWMALL